MVSSSGGWGSISTKDRYSNGTNNVTGVILSYNGGLAKCPSDATKDQKFNVEL